MKYAIIRNFATRSAIFFGPKTVTFAKSANLWDFEISGAPILMEMEGKYKPQD